MTDERNDETPGALDDIRVLDLAGEIGQYCTKLLADLGADVIKIEPPEGDPVRDLPPFYHDEPGPDHSLYWWNLNTNKRSVTLNLGTSEGQEVFRKLAATADVVVESFDPGYMDSLELGYSALSAKNPRLIFTSITGFGQTGPHAHYKAPDIVGVAMSGVMWLAGEPQDQPNLPPWRQGYISASIIGAAGTLVALYSRDATGEGQQVDVSMQEALSLSQETAMQTWDMLQVLRVRNGSKGIIPFEIPGIGVYECSDGYVYGYVGTPGGAPWSDVLAWMAEEGKAEDLIEDPYLDVCNNLNMRFLSSIATDPEVQKKLVYLPHLAEVLRRFAKTKSKWEMYEQAQHRRLLFGIVSTPEDLAKNPQLQHKKWLTAVEHTEIGATVQYPGAPYQFAETPWEIRRRPPLRGEHNSEIYEEAGLSPADVLGLSTAGVI
jgi:crotonobetainyl-CoA:carnitine CoA-transferase CaiB-like acyl-CoA transferase